jgi:hypothetical protein
VGRGVVRLQQFGTPPLFFPFLFFVFFLTATIYFAVQDPGDIELQGNQRVLVVERTSDDWYVWNPRHRSTRTLI